MSDRRTASILILHLLCGAIVAVALNAPAYGFTTEQVQAGEQVYRLQCARCHGPEGQGVTNIYHGLTAPPLIGNDAFPTDPRPYQKIRHFQLHDVRDVFEFASAVMPLDQPGSLTGNDYWNVIAYLLSANGLEPDGQALSEASARQIGIPLSAHARGGAASVRGAAPMARPPADNQ